MALPRAFLTVAEFESLPDRDNGERRELIDGEMIVAPASVTRRQRVAKRVMLRLDEHVTTHDLGEVFVTGQGVYLSTTNLVIPDVCFVAAARQHIVRENYIYGAPDLIVEILSPGNRRNDLVLKRNLYARFGVGEYWQIDPEAQRVTVLALEGEGHAEVAPAAAGVVTSRVAPGLRMAVADLFVGVP
ncbi:MAG: Uma2 family endonuclease [Thermomicrobiales bacterium]